MIFKVASVQMKCELGNKSQNIARMCWYIHQIKTSHPDIGLIVFPECAVSGYECPELYDSLAEEYPQGESIRLLCSEAGKNDVYLVFGFTESGQDGNIYNSAAIIDNEGHPLGCYRKAHLVQGMETEHFCMGDSFPVFDTKYGKIGIMICWDSVFPEVARLLALHGAELVVVPEAVEKGIEREWDLALGARAFDNVCYLLSCNHAGRDRTLQYFGRSTLFSPLGEAIEQLGEEEDSLIASIDTDEISKCRDYFYMLRQRRPEVYSDLVNK